MAISRRSFLRASTALAGLAAIPPAVAASGTLPAVPVEIVRPIGTIRFHVICHGPSKSLGTSSSWDDRLDAHTGSFGEWAPATEAAGPARAA